MLNFSEILFVAIPLSILGMFVSAGVIKGVNKSKTGEFVLVANKNDYSDCTKLSKDFLKNIKVDEDDCSIASAHGIIDGYGFNNEHTIIKGDDKRVSVSMFMIYFQEYRRKLRTGGPDLEKIKRAGEDAQRRIEEANGKIDKAKLAECECAVKLGEKAKVRLEKYKNIIDLCKEAKVDEHFSDCMDFYRQVANAKDDDMKYWELVLQELLYRYCC